jgi:ubiquinone biosynthesis protein UbiJ
MNVGTTAPPARLPGFLRDIMQTASNRLLDLDPDVRRDLGDLEGHVFRIRLTGPDIEFFIAPTAEGLSFPDEYDGEVSTTLQGSPFALFSLSVGEKNGGIAAGHVEIAGDVEAGRRFAEILKRLDPDWEEPLSMMMGDVAAHEIGRFMRGGLSWARDVSGRMAENMARYATEERRDVVSGSELAGFLSDVDQLRDDVDRLEARMRQLVRKTTGEAGT